MAHRGVKPALKEIAGCLEAVPAMPSHLPLSMRQEWIVLATDLTNRKMITSATLGTLETYVRSLWLAREAQKAIEEHGLIVKTEKGSTKANPATTTLNESQTTIARLASELGLTPASRSRSGMGGDTPKPDNDDALGL
ncbi:phage terminase small subunit P27 family [Pararhizobium qamdonense]|uniref:phage terminase small subunit P27 family n=1 Tax=Pararhizobium qamdonense TaxID=3031126 RepID=UPI0023E299AE|nr:phage terminase small subunit P27 family [Pararhizobium qamdonense]